MKEITVYQCDYCKKLLRSELAIQKHETQYCFYSPHTHSCATCRYCFTEETNGNFKCELGLICEEELEEYSIIPAHPWKHCADWKLVNIELDNLQPAVFSKSIGVVRLDVIDKKYIKPSSKKRFEEYKNLIRKFAQEA